MTSPQERPTFSELRYGDKRKGLECPQCGCCDFRVSKTRPGDNEITRYRICRHCGYRRATVES